MLRNNFVSNSSSCSFVVKFKENEKQIDERFIDVMSKFPHYVSFKAKKDHLYSQKLISRLDGKAFMHPKLCDKKFLNAIKLELVDAINVDMYKITNDDIELINDIIKESKELYCDCGYDWDPCAKLEMIQFPTLLNYFYDFDIQIDDHEDMDEQLTPQLFSDYKRKDKTSWDTQHNSTDLSN